MTATNLTFEDYLPKSVNNITYTAHGWNCNQNNGKLTCTGLKLPAGGTGEITISGKINATIEDKNANEDNHYNENGQNHRTNVAKIRNDKPHSEDISAVIFKLLLPGLQIKKTADKPLYQSGERAIFTITLTNTGDFPITIDKVEDILPDGFTLQKILESSGYPFGDLEVKDQNPNETVQFSGGEVYYSNKEQNLAIDLDTLNFRLVESLDVEKIILSVTGSLDKNAIASISLSGVAGARNDNNKAFVFDFDNDPSAFRNLTEFNA